MAGKSKVTLLWATLRSAGVTLLLSDLALLALWTLWAVDWHLVPTKCLGEEMP